MKKTCSVELKIIIAAIAIMLSLFTVVIVNQVFGKNEAPMKFVYNYQPREMTAVQDFNS